MLCSEIELGLGQDASGIMILPPDVPLGADLGEALGLKDTILDLSITPNRPDWLCVIGVAREIAALTHQRVKYPRLYPFRPGGGDSPEDFCDYSGSGSVPPLCGKDDRRGEDRPFSPMDEGPIGKSGGTVHQ